MQHYRGIALECEQRGRFAWGLQLSRERAPFRVALSESGGSFHGSSRNRTHFFRLGTGGRQDGRGALCAESTVVVSGANGPAPLPEELRAANGDVHVHLFGTATLSYGRHQAQDEDVFEIQAAPFGLLLRNPLLTASVPPVTVQSP